MKKTIVAVTVVTMLGWANAVYAEAGDWLFRVGGSVVAPKSDNHPAVEVEDGYMLTFNGTYFINNNWAVEVLASLPFKHDIEAVGGGTVGETKHLPPTVSAQYHFLPDGNIRPYVGAGLNYTFLFEEDFDGADLELDNSFGWAAQVGVDIDISENMFVNAEVRYIDIDADGELTIPGVGKVDIDTVEIDPVVVGLSVGFRF
jgi:outer membrane protein